MLITVKQNRDCVNFKQAKIPARLETFKFLRGLILRILLFYDVLFACNSKLDSLFSHTSNFILTRL